jgi:hypothetical protein
MTVDSAEREIARGEELGEFVADGTTCSKNCVHGTSSFGCKNSSEFRFRKLISQGNERRLLKAESCLGGLARLVNSIALLRIRGMIHL